MVKSLRKPLLISLATVVVVISGVIGLLAIDQHTGPATEPTPEPTTSSTPSSLTGIGVYAFTAGLQYVDNPSTVISDLKSSRFQPEGIDWVVGWRVIEPSQGRYDWTTLDKDLRSEERRV